ncbi:hypothetical protein D9_0172 [Aeromonas phage D9]|uniref:Uncharacterized protein n=2 Tax=Ludhianavirus TaxID=3044751 RepID=A0A514A1E9_9CAUD|nr:hypothetical protein PQC06_gp007 [Aeromonas phage LAh10]YP_010668822.1 hypothetical protein PQC08_gp201 [Aeromonas phage D6]QDH47101.1 hypothetical protein LAh10_7 [Aeromonas phage LAh10]QDJ97234.1 hypothetical protein D6_0074 [Aeromonas phage D6]QEP52379.1 hypothetical protein D9_0172 [Aeromonas phage D9]
MFKSTLINTTPVVSVISEQENEFNFLLVYGRTSGGRDIPLVIMDTEAKDIRTQAEVFLRMMDDKSIDNHNASHFIWRGPYLILRTFGHRSFEATISDSRTEKFGSREGHKNVLKRLIGVITEFLAGQHDYSKYSVETDTIKHVFYNESVIVDGTASISRVQSFNAVCKTLEEPNKKMLTLTSIKGAINIVVTEEMDLSGLLKSIERGVGGESFVSTETGANNFGHSSLIYHVMEPNKGCNEPHIRIIHSTKSKGASLAFIATPLFIERITEVVMSAR